MGGQTRQHARLINLLGVKQLAIGVNKMDAAIGGEYSETRYNEIRDEMKLMLARVGWKKDFVEKSVAILPISGWNGDDLLSKSDKMPFWKGADIVSMSGNKVHVDCLKDLLNDFVEPPSRDLTKAMRVPISGIYKIKGVGDVLTGRVEQGVIKPNDEVVFMPTHTPGTPCTGKVFTVEMHHKKIEEGKAGDNIGMNLKGLDKQNMLRTGHAACRVKEIVWKVGKETGGKKLEAPHSLKSNEMAEIVFAPCQPLVVDSFKNCEGLSRIAFLDGNSAVMLGKVTKCTQEVAK